MRVFLKRLMLIVLALWPMHSAACIGHGSLQQTFFQTLPNVLEQEPVVARVRVLHKELPGKPRKKASVVPYPPFIFADVQFRKAFITVEVIDGFRGVTQGYQFVVALELHSCTVGTNVKIGSDWYVARELKDGQFSGA